MTSSPAGWNAGLYDASHSFVWKFAQLLDLLAPRPDERILDLGCGPGPLRHKIAAAASRLSASTVRRRWSSRPGVLFPSCDSKSPTASGR